jgi:CheY-like chemotaxis protein
MTMTVDNQENGWRMRVLVVEDHADTSQTMAVLLRLAGYAVESVSDGVAALAAARANPPDVVLLDIGLPGMDGWQLARSLIQQPAPKRPLLVAVTGYGQEDDRRRSQEAGIDLHLVKPVDPVYLRQLLARFRQVIAEPQPVHA